MLAARAAPPGGARITDAQHPTTDDRSPDAVRNAAVADAAIATMPRWPTAMVRDAADVTRQQIRQQNRPTLAMRATSPNGARTTDAQRPTTDDCSSESVRNAAVADATIATMPRWPTVMVRDAAGVTRQQETRQQKTRQQTRQQLRLR
jgi:hypothetical protein